MRVPDFYENYRVFQIIVEKITEVQCHWIRHIFNLPAILSLIGTLVPHSKHF